MNSIIVNLVTLPAMDGPRSFSLSNLVVAEQPLERAIV
jgi:hypothetical protein